MLYVTGGVVVVAIVVVGEFLQQYCPGGHVPGSETSGGVQLEQAAVTHQEGAEQAAPGGAVVPGLVQAAEHAAKFCAEVPPLYNPLPEGSIVQLYEGEPLQLYVLAATVVDVVAVQALHGQFA